MGTKRAMRENGRLFRSLVGPGLPMMLPIECKAQFIQRLDIICESRGVTREQAIANGLALYDGLMRDTGAGVKFMHDHSNARGPIPDGNVQEFRLTMLEGKE